MTKAIRRTTQFKKDIKRAQKRGRDFHKLYRATEDELILIRTGTDADLFKN